MDREILMSLQAHYAVDAGLTYDEAEEVLSKAFIKEDKERRKVEVHREDGTIDYFELRTIVVYDSTQTI
jgi:hypothetical protein